MWHRRRIVFWLVVAAQLASILTFAGWKEVSLRTGQEIVLETAPVDPRDVFRGDYVVLRYQVSELDGCGFGVGNVVYVPLERQGDVWVSKHWAFGLSTTYERAAEHAEIVLRGRVVRSTPPTCEVAYGIESYFVPEGTGRDIERIRGGLKVRANVDGAGNAMIRGLILPDS